MRNYRRRRAWLRVPIILACVLGLLGMEFFKRFPQYAKWEGIFLIISVGLVVLLIAVRLVVVIVDLITGHW